MKPTVTNLRKTLERAGIILPELGIWKNRRADCWIVNAGAGYAEAEAVLLAAGFNVRHASPDLITVYR